MIEMETKLKGWGNSIGLVIPKNMIRVGNLKPKQRVRVIIKPVKVLKVRDLFGKFKNIKKPTDQIMKEIDRDLDSKFF